MGSAVLIRNICCVTISMGLKSDCNINESAMHLAYKTINTQNDQGISPCTKTYKPYTQIPNEGGVFTAYEYSETAYRGHMRYKHDASAQ
jgi:hypothetical protein